MSVGEVTVAPAPGTGEAVLPAPGKTGEASDRWLPHVFRIAGLAGLVGLWAVVAAVVNSRFFPGPVPVFQDMVAIVASGEFFVHMWHTLFRVLVGFCSAFGVAIVVGIAMGAYRRVEQLFDFEVLVGLTVPGLAWSLITLILFGLNEFASITAVFVGALPLLTLNVWEGTKALDRELIDMAHAFHISRASVITSVVLPQLVPYLFAATRLGLSVAWKLVVVVEMFGMSNGIGYMLHYNFGIYSMSGVLAWTFSFTVILAFLEFFVLRRVEARVTRWRPAVSL